jgi:hypothetical protein
LHLNKLADKSRIKAILAYPPGAADSASARTNLTGLILRALSEVSLVNSWCTPRFNRKPAQLDAPALFSAGWSALAQSVDSGSLAF